MATRGYLDLETVPVLGQAGFQTVARVVAQERAQAMGLGEAFEPELVLDWLHR